MDSRQCKRTSTSAPCPFAVICSRHSRKCVSIRVDLCREVKKVNLFAQTLNIKPELTEHIQHGRLDDCFADFLCAKKKESKV